MRRTEASTGSIYIDCEKLRPADILLTSNRSALSIGIRRFTLGPFSHAALVMEETFLLEATGEGTGHTPLVCARLEYPTASHAARRLHLLSASTTCAVVLRRPELNGVTMARLTELSNPFLWQQYPALASTVTVFDSPQMMSAGAALLRLHARLLKAPPSNPGLFCSQLVAAIFEALNSPLIKGVAAERFSPNRILRAGLQEVPDAVTVPDPSAEIDEVRREFVNKMIMLPFAPEVLPALVEFKAKVEELKHRGKSDS